VKAVAAKKDAKDSDAKDSDAKVEAAKDAKTDKKEPAESA